MSHPVRLTLVVVGLAMAVYGVASLTGAWLGTPPWWVTYRALDVEKLEHGAVYAEYRSDYRAKYYARVEAPYFTLEDLSDASLIIEGGGSKELFRLRPDAPRRRPWEEFAVPVRWGRFVRPGWEWVGWILAKVGLLVVLAAVWPRGRRTALGLPSCLGGSGACVR